MTTSIGHLAKKSGVSIAAIRYYESLGLLPAADRKANGHREFSSEALAALKIVRALREAGLTLSDVQKFISILADRNAPCSDLADLARNNAALIREKILLLRQAEERLRTFAVECSENCRKKSAAACGQVATIAFSRARA